MKTFRSKGMPTYRAESGQGMGSFKVGDIVCSPRDGDVIGTVASWDTTTSKFVVIVAGDSQQFAPGSVCCGHAVGLGVMVIGVLAACARSATQPPDAQSTHHDPAGAHPQTSGHMGARVRARAYHCL